MQVYDKARNAVALALSPVVRALVDPDGALQQVRDLDDVSIPCFYFRSIKSVHQEHSFAIVSIFSKCVLF